jgi:hypothetical protein
MPNNLFQRIENFWEQRREFRAAALTALRKRENLPSPVDAEGTPLETRFDDNGNVHYFNPQGQQVDKVLFANAGKDGKPGAFAIGTKKQEPRELAEQNWHRTDNEFEILEVSEDGKRIQDELEDLNRDSATYAQAGRVSHGEAGEQAPGFEISGTSDEEVDARLQEYLKRGN